jgi:HSP20 family protein
MEELDRMTEELWEGWRPMVTLSTGFTPRMDMYEEKDELVIRTELPGVRKEDLDISIKGDVLSLKAETKQEDVTKERGYYLCERSFGQYSRSVSLPFAVDTSKASATFENGLLEIRLSKAEEAKPKQIEVKVK